MREIVGSRPIVVTLDLHANITPDTVKYPDVIIGFDTYPHIDTYERGVEAVEIIYKTVRGEVRPTMAYRQLPLFNITTGTVYHETTDERPSGETPPARI